jgi:serine/threonine-protein kinase
MKPERWQQIDELFDAALERPATERRAYLQAVCGDDQELRKELESLLKAAEQAKSFIEAPPHTAIEEIVPTEAARLRTGQQVAQFKILSLLGAGGMGEVYLAEDSKLGRKVALKILPAEFTKNPERIQRFKQEARAASGLNHPNILTIYDIDQIDDTPIMATEFVEGETLRTLIKHERLEVKKALDLIGQVAKALAAAHQAGIVHRDIKPENIMMRSDGLVKVLDFGLAKLSRSPSGEAHEQLAGELSLRTAPGIVMGTVCYMSPEQARGLAVDARTDIWSLGVVLYEMLTGHAPFEGTTSSDIIAAILQSEPPPLSYYLPELSDELQRLVGKTLEKNCAARYQSIKEFCEDLNRVNANPGTSEAGKQVQQPEIQDQIATKDLASSGSASGAGGKTAPRQFFWHQGKVVTGLVAAGLLIVIAIGLYWRAQPGASAMDSIAILPFLNEGANPDIEYLCDGITESLINSFSHLSKLRVVPRSTSFRYKGQQFDPQEIGQKLGVRAVVTGKVTQRGDILHIQVDLIDVKQMAQMWGEGYKRKFSDILKVKEEISRSIAGELRLQLSSGEQQQLTKHETRNPEAYTAYLQGRFWEDRRTEEGFKRAIAYFNQAIEKDPNYALPWAGLAGSYGGLSDHGFLTSKEGFTKAKEAVKRALELDDELAEAHTEFAADLCFYDWDFAGAEPEYKRGIELNPNSSLNHYLYGSFLSIVGRHDEALAEKRRAQELEPSSIINNFGIGWALYRARRYEEAIESLNQTLEMDRGFSHTYRGLGLCYLQKLAYDEAIKNLREAVTLEPTHSGFIASLGCAYGRAGRRGEALKLLADLNALSTQRYVGSYDMAMIYAGLGDKEHAFAELEKAFVERSNQLVYLNAEPAWETLHSDPRFADLSRRMRLPQ